MTPEAIKKQDQFASFFCELKNNYYINTTETDCAIYMIGYQGMKVDNFLKHLMNYGIKRIIDVRKNPLSRTYGFHKNTLSRFAECLGIEYKHRPDLGVPAEWRKNLRQPEDYKLLFNRYKNEILTNSNKSINEISGMMSDKPSVLMCWEADPSYCHRNCLAESISVISHMHIQDLRADNEDWI
jgi:uncharacterized protein (DUF488 family)